MENKLTTLINPYLDFIDNGNLFRKPLSWLYLTIAILNLVFPLSIFYHAIYLRAFYTDIKTSITLFFAWLIILFIGLVSFQLWMRRRTQIPFPSGNTTELFAAPIFSHFIKTLGEWLGTWVGSVGFCFSFIAILLFGADSFYWGRLGMPFGGFFGSAWVGIFLMPIIGLLIILLTRFLSEQMIALSAIANNTKKQ